MKKCFLLLLLFISASDLLQAQEILPGISVRNANGKIIVSWRNEYQKPVTTINIQRSYDSLANYTTIGSVLNPQNKENGYADLAAPYGRMYYRVFIAFEGGSYILSTPSKPGKDTGTYAATVKYPWQVDPNADPNLNVPPVNIPVTPTSPAIPYPSKWVFTARDNNVVIYLPDVETKKYSVKFFDELDTPLFELNNLKDDYLIIEKVNFKKSGWYHFELLESGKTVERNRFFIGKDGRVTNDTPRRSGNR
ncbi:MAG: hypothetical protein EOO13_17330 [Chitinophagaceae bacterium]|nr:MAG: hypothetical protein EOO13_17330 [Chitinophagaceae bacterium]